MASATAVNIFRAAADHNPNDRQVSTWRKLSRFMAIVQVYWDDTLYALYIKLSQGHAT